MNLCWKKDPSYAPMAIATGYLPGTPDRRPAAVYLLVVVMVVLVVVLARAAVGAATPSACKNARVECHSRIALYVPTCSGCMLRDAGCMLEKAGCMLGKASYLHPLDDPLQEVESILNLVVVLIWQPVVLVVSAGVVVVPPEEVVGRRWWWWRWRWVVVG
ncbi:hypothetical protein CYMTET_23151 [Cymbomonas tetramitiformis]|uniref:Uncharacterized protein n=1 Tax=Cymbomonas tetramitiformis TaxID=36881 RepID=A0AAE0FZZ4_9CHLO|nr:hypothetical protein CYMTET_23151 [Cymbomonas tetramitiformis]